MMNALVDLVIYIVLIVLVCGLLLWLIDQVPIPEHFRHVARIAIIVVAISLIISVLLSLVAGGPPHLRLSEMPMADEGLGASLRFAWFTRFQRIGQKENFAALGDQCQLQRADGGLKLGNLQFQSAPRADQLGLGVASSVSSSA
jgi:hypothetical protein